MSVTQRIEPKQILLKTQDNHKHNVCAYCRVSTDDKDQRNSLTSQQDFFSSFFSKHPNWNNIGIFADEGISGTSLEKRDAFNKMLKLAKNGAVEIILTKEVSRFSRNVQHLLNIVEELRCSGVYIWFLSDDINTQSNDYRERLTQIATNAEQESLRTSRRVRWGQQQKMEQGAVLGPRVMFGYWIQRDALGVDHFIAVPEEAEVIRLIFQWFASGDGTYTIAKRLTQMGIDAKKYKSGWNSTTILRLLRNEKYVGDLSQGKTYTPDPLTHKKKYNNGQSVLYYITDHHAESAIVDRTVWNKVQSILNKNSRGSQTKANNTNRRWLSAKLYCGCCGSKYVHIQKKAYSAWVCSNYNQWGRPNKRINETGECRTVGCSGQRINERVLKAALWEMLQPIIIGRREDIYKSVIKDLSESFCRQDYSKHITALQQRINKSQESIFSLTDKYVKGHISEQIYVLSIQRYEQEVVALKENLRKYTMRSSAAPNIPEYMGTIEEILSFADNRAFDLFSRLVDHIIVHPHHILELQFSFRTHPIRLRYRTTGRGERFAVEFDIVVK